MSRIFAGAAPFVVMVTRVLGPGPLRLSMVKLTHTLRDGDMHFHGGGGRLAEHAARH